MIVKATAHWNTCATREPLGEVYAEERGVIEAVYRGIVRFDRADHDSLALALRTGSPTIAQRIAGHDVPTAWCLGCPVVPWHRAHRPAPLAGRDRRPFVPIGL